MADVQFDAENEFARAVPQATGPTGIQGFLLQKGVVKNVQQAQLLLMVVLVLSVGITVWAVMSLSNDAESPKELDQYIQKMKNIKPPR